MSNQTVKVLAPAPVKLKPVQVTLPIVRLKLEDLRYMQGLLDPKLKCHPNRRVMDRLVILGMIEEETVPPCPKALKQFAKNDLLARRMMLDSMKSKFIDWEKHAWKYDWKTMPQERKRWILTKAGRALVQNGHTQVQVKKGC